MKIAIIITIGIFLATASIAERTPESKCGTILIRRTLSGLGGGISIEIINARRFMRPARTYNYNTPEGHFKIHYDLIGYNAVDSIGYVHKIGVYLERCWALYIDTIGYFPPPPDGAMGGDPKYDVYLSNIGSYGYTWPGGDGPSPWEDLTSYIEIDNNFSTAYPNDDPEGPVAGAMKVTCAHEFHHAIQYGLRGSSSEWLAELTSTAMEERVYPHVNDYIWLVNYLSDSPHLPITWRTGYHMYGLALLAQYWNIIYGDEFLFSVWDTIRFLPDWVALTAECVLRRTTLAEDFSRFASIAFLIGSRHGGFYPDGRSFRDMRIENTHRSYPTGGSPSNRPYGYGINYILFENFGTDPNDLSISFNGSPSAIWRNIAIYKTLDTILFVDMPVDRTGRGSLRLPFANNADFIALSIVPEGDTVFSYNYNYSAELVPANIAEIYLPVKNVVSISPNPFNTSCRITSDSLKPIEIYDIGGKLIDSIIPVKYERYGISCFSAIWDANDLNGNPAKSGIYFFKIGDSKIIKGILIK